MRKQIAGWMLICCFLLMAGGDLFASDVLLPGLSFNCDSTLHDSITVEICPGDTVYIAGLPFSVPYQGDIFLQSQDGCDSVLHLEVIQNLPAGTEIFRTICSNDSLEWHGRVLDEQGIYKDTLSTQKGCDSVVILHLQKNRERNPYITTSAAPGFAGQVVSIRVEGIAPAEVGSIHWSGASIGCDSCLYTTARLLSEENIFTADLIDKDGCSYELSIAILIGLDIYIPNVFRPNGDGINDYFRPYAAGPLYVDELSVYNRWGNQVYERRKFVLTQDFKGWDGNLNNEKLVPGPYLYQMRLRLPNGELTTYKGELLLLR